MRLCLASGIEEVIFTSRVLIAALGDVAVRAGIKSIIGNFDASKLRLYRRIGCEVEFWARRRDTARLSILGCTPISEAIVRRVWEKVQG